MKRDNSGFSLIEIVVAMAILGLFATATCSSLVLGLRMNGKTETLLNAQLAVSSAVETLMAEGIKTDFDAQTTPLESAYKVVIDNITAPEEQDKPYCKVEVKSNDNEVSVTTYIRKAVS